MSQVQISQRLVPLCCVVLFVLGWGESAGAVDDPLDLVVLIDVSGSMYSRNPQRGNGAVVDPDGSDVERIRWDAVKLLLDLATPADRVQIVRFNNECPAQFWHRVIVMQNGQPRVFNAGAEGKPGPAFLAGLKGAAQNPEWELLSRERTLLEQEVLLHNTRSDELEFDIDNDVRKLKNGFDFGGTGIVTALLHAETILKAPLPRSMTGATARRPQILLLTDGIDDQLQPENKKRYDPVKFKRQQTQILGTLRGRKVPIHVLGLKLENTAAPVTARETLRTLAGESGGIYREVDDARDLICVFRELIRDLKGYWTSDAEFAAGAPAELSISVGYGLEGLGVLAYGLPLSAPTSKHATLMPEDLTSEWTGATWGKEGAPSFARRHGKVWQDLPHGSLYEYLYVGPTGGDAGSTTGSHTPFRNLPEKKGDSDPSPALKLAMKTQPHGQRVIVFKKPVNEPFSLVKPTAQDNLTRWDRLRIQVLMDVGKLDPRHFALHAEFRLIPESKTDGALVACAADMQSGVKTIPLTPRTISPHRVEFSAEPCLDELLPVESTGTVACEVSIVVQGTPDHPHLLAGCRRRFPPVTLSVRNEPLSLKATVTALVLDDVTTPKSFKLEPADPTKCVVHPLPLKFALTPPARDGQPVNVAHFNLGAESVKGSGTLLPGKEMTLLLQEANGKSITRGVAYRPGKLEFSSAAGGARVAAPLTLEVRLELGLIPLSFSSRPQPLDTLTRSHTQAMSIAVEAGKNYTGKIELSLISPKKDDNSSRFVANELWLQKGTGTDTEKVESAPPTDRKQTLTVQPGETFHVGFLPEANAEKGQFDYQLQVRAEGTTNPSTSGRLHVKQFQVNCDPERVELFAEPASTARAEMSLSLKAGSGAKADVYFQGTGSGKPAICQFRRSEPGAKDQRVYELSVTGPTETSPVTIHGPAADGTPQVEPVPISVVVPSGGPPPGEYSGMLQIAGREIDVLNVPIRLTVDQLQVSIVESADQSVRGWGDDPERFVQQSQKEVSYELQVSRASGKPLAQDAVEASVPTFEGPGGERLAPPTVVKSVGPGGTIRVRITFSVVSGSFVKGAYTARFSIERNRQLVDPPFSLVSREFQVQYLRVQDLLEPPRAARSRPSK